ncbi:class F sortase [Microbispora sp. H11081]|uniref:class F sortase n=1 Tax=Microbispora sp. H11081 TaxID=2729107 RepID=UPI001476478A|nr:class F sortase [Microbispora sp. H11081]
MGKATVAVLLGLTSVAATAAVAVTVAAGLAGDDRAAPPPAPPASVSTPRAQPKSTTRALPPSPPVLLEIPKIGVRTTLMSLGKNPDGTLEVPPLDRVDEAGWYRLGPSPGARGPAVIAGHVDSTKGPGVFFKLGALRPGDTVRISRKDGTRAVFEVDSLESVPKDSFPTRKVYGMVKTPVLRLITCGGDFDRAGGHYRDNIIVYARLVATHRPKAVAPSTRSASGR